MTNRRKIKVFVITFLLLHLVLLVVFFIITSETSALVKDQKKIESLKEAPKFLFTGDSHPNRCIEERNIKNSFNLSFYGENPILTHFRLKYLLERLHIKPKYIFLQADITRFSADYFNRNENYFFYGKYIDYKELLDAEIINHERYLKSIAYLIFPYIELKTVLKKNNMVKIKKGKQKFSDFSSIQKQINTELFIKHKLLSNNPKNLYYEDALIFFRKTIELCQSHQIKVIGIKYPVTDYYLNTLKQFCGENMLSNPPQDKILLEYNIPIWDFEGQYLDRYDYFFDSHHMNEDGKTDFTTVLKNKINKEFNEK
ncbi:hypothetical protein FRY74_10440 [Vicingus serpentipes]|uniref:DUF1574 domain-containing protein n=1 Tax=Vicingus serpentipes TaxID=1926625 RepID=A0A5C6RSC1_9FLAO|nr:hypothetical protein [Vicingus serpentipes]TXB64202.1 hypothetical protein FRY74_10440 [Vicingus serpentipes]